MTFDCKPFGVKWWRHARFVANFRSFLQPCEMFSNYRRRKKSPFMSLIRKILERNRLEFFAAAAGLSLKHVLAPLWEKIEIR